MRSVSEKGEANKSIQALVSGLLLAMMAADSDVGLAVKRQKERGEHDA